MMLLFYLRQQSNIILKNSHPYIGIDNEEINIHHNEMMSSTLSGTISAYIPNNHQETNCAGDSLCLSTTLTILL